MIVINIALLIYNINNVNKSESLPLFVFEVHILTYINVQYGYVHVYICTYVCSLFCACIFDLCFFLVCLFVLSEICAHFIFSTLWELTMCVHVHVMWMCVCVCVKGLYCCCCYCGSNSIASILRMLMTSALNFSLSLFVANAISLFTFVC